MAESTNRHDLGSEDAQRLERLSEEVRSRLLEIALITARAAQKGSPRGAVTSFTTRAAERKLGDAGTDAGAGNWVEIIDVDGVEACYGVIDGKPFAESPCGAAQ